MPSAERKKLAEAQAEALKHLDAVRAELLKLPNVIAVGLGLKETGGQFTKQLCYRVYVKKKVDEAVLGAGVIPKTIAGLPTDVLIPLRFTPDNDVCGEERTDAGKHRPLRAGIRVGKKTGLLGTLGWFGKLGDGTLVMISNEHIFYGEGLAVNTVAKKIGQPKVADVSKCCCCGCGSDNIVGETIVGLNVTGTATTPGIDAAIARINADLASEVLFEITNDNTEEVLTVGGSGNTHAAAIVGEAVRKVGARSGFTRGTVIHIGDMAALPNEPDGDPITDGLGRVLIIPADGETYELKSGGVCKRAFTNNGDSGAVVLNEDDEIIALHHAGNRKAYSVSVSMGCVIQAVLDALSAQGQPITLSRSSDGGDRGLGKALPLRASAARDDVEWFVRARDQNRESVLYDLVMRHQHEVVRLVNHKRAVTVAWQRNKGPAFIAALARSGRVARYRVPFEIEGVSRERLLLAMEQALQKHGSAALKRDMAAYREQALNIAMTGRTVDELAKLLKAQGLIERVPGHQARARVAARKPMKQAS
jgi:hypothetical protein